MQESLSGIPSCVREQFSILVDNIKTLTEVRREVGPGPVGEQVDREVHSHLEALGELRERVFHRALSGGDDVAPLEKHITRVEILDLSQFPLLSSARSEQALLSH